MPVHKINMLHTIHTHAHSHRPEHCADELYEIMCSCLQHNAEDRPTFEDILTKLVKEE